MNKLFLIAGLVLFTSFGIFNEREIETNFINQGDTLKPLKPLDVHASEAYVITNLLKRIHYKKLALSDSISSIIFENYFKTLDPNRAYFYASDIARFEKYRYELDNQISKGELQFAYDVFHLYRKRALNQIDFIFSLLESEFDFTKDEAYTYDRDEEDQPKTEAEKNEIWRKIIKSQALTYKLSGREWEDIAKGLISRYKRIEKAIYQYNSEDVFQTYINSYTYAYDPHTNYFSPPDAKNFEIGMKLSLEGIGASLTQNLDYTQVAAIIAGGPAYKSKQLHKDDKIIGVAQGDDGEFDDVIGWRLDDVVAKIRGAKGSIVRLQILKETKGINALPDTLRLIRDKINLEQQAAKAEMIPISEYGKTYNLGVITIPSFYIDFEELKAGKKDYRSTTRDVKKLILELESQDMDGLMIDLRFNGGGSLQEAIEMSGLFIPDGPVVQVKNYDQTIDKMEDEDGGEVFYDGALAILVNRGSASASEIFSGAIQDYKRGIIIGENTFGKGTVQNIIALNRYIKNPDVNVGQIKMTLAKFYRVTGSSNQKVGITPDIQFPSIYTQEEYGEASRENALPWDQIQSTNFKPSYAVSEELLDYLNTLYREDLNTDPALKKMVQTIEKTKETRNLKAISLNLETRKAIQSDDEELEMTVSESEISDTEERNKKLKEDPYLKESLRLLVAVKKFKVG